MGRRAKRATRCSDCRMLAALCVCSLIPAIRTAGPWVVLQHRTERHKTTNTGHLGVRSLVGARLCVVHSRTEPAQPPVGPLEDAWVLFPGEDSADPADLPPGATLIVPDGTWTQARKMVRTHASVRDLPRVGLPPGAVPRWSLREETSPGGMSTLDAMCWLLSAVEGPEVSAALEALAEAQWRRTLQSRGAPPPSPADAPWRPKPRA